MRCGVHSIPQVYKYLLYAYSRARSTQRSGLLTTENDVGDRYDVAIDRDQIRTTACGPMFPVRGNLRWPGPACLRWIWDSEQEIVVLSISRLRSRVARGSPAGAVISHLFLARSGATFCGWYWDQGGFEVVIGSDARLSDSWIEDCICK